ncbi:HNH nuclease [Knoellia sinensis KCTC 19936]|uniref:HNH nuclease n=1 Tax=Knoellia sinensis KCTC 19936 TaxID=1385520 RepID=A0A0A0J4J2_9MICO|nr:HNH endonuclease signature motif containing protein [Knoellia sinensis]KGN30506.1 HNH nuclease [Knoellia sinensis KCTC 19936]
MSEQQEAPSTPLRAALTAAHDRLLVVGDVLASLSAAELAELMTLADKVKAQAAATQVRVTAEAAHRGEFTAARRGVGTAHAWVREHAPSLRQGSAGQVAQFASDAAAATPAGEWSHGGPTAGAYADDSRPEGIVWPRVVSGEIGVGLALTALREAARMKDLLTPEALPTVTGAILDHGVLWGQAEARKLRPRLLAEHGIEGEFDDSEKKLRGGAFLSSPVVADGDLTEYRMAMTPEQAARLEASIGPLSKPAPNADTGEADLRPAGQRRVEALTTVLGGVASRDAGQGGPGGAATVLHVSMALADLLAGLAGAGGAVGAGGMDLQGCGRVMGSRAQQTMLSPSTVRRMACDADVLPVVLGAHGEVVDLGRATRLFSRGQRRVLWHRDRQCTFPGCDAPATWAQAHHLVHWADGGPSDLSNAALLCQRHHTQVHDRRLIATVHPPDEWGRCVVWDLTPGSYDEQLPRRLAEFAHRRQRDPDDATARLRRLDTGPPDAWAMAIPDWLSHAIAADLEAEHLAAQQIEDGWDDVPWDDVA